MFSVVVLFAFGGMRLLETFGPHAAQDSFGIRYVEHPIVGVAHIVPGLVFLLLAPLQFIPRIRRRHLAIHRASGRLLVVLAAVSGVFALVAAFRFPAFGGATTQAATVVFGVWFLGSLWKAVDSIRKRRVAQHREWMIRVFAIGLAVATVRVVIGLAQLMTGLEMVHVFGASFWLGFGINAAVAETWIRRSRGSGRPSARARNV
ncbi:MAG: DUF2306 domain-containing protein [Longimicrobiales bacterium]